MGKALFMIYLLGILIFWDLSMKVRDVISRGWARKYLDRSLPVWCHQLLTVARLFTDFRAEYSRAIPGVIEGPALVIANHQSLIDIVAIRAAIAELNLRFVAKYELRRWVLGVSEALRLQRHALVRRTGRVEEGLSELKRIATMARTEQVSPVVFPEGTRSRTGQVMAFRTGALRIILNETPLPLVVCAIHGGYRLRSLREVAKNFAGSRYRVRVLTRLPPPRTRRELNMTVSQAEHMIREQVEQWQSEDMNA